MKKHEVKKRFRWGALGAVAAVPLALAACEGREEPLVSPEGEETSTFQTLRDLDALVVSPPVVMVRRVEFEGVAVRSVPSDRAFYIGGEAENRQMLAILAYEPHTPRTPVEGRVNLDEGDTVNLRGTLQRDSAEEISTTFGVPPEALRAEAGEETVYILVHAISEEGPPRL